jgi:hypothetical protein|nr:MAG TPA: hypothetical protein [Caudoviricetes sp.]
MGFEINGTPIPDPSSFSGAVSDLDTLGERDSGGTLRRNKIAEKYHTRLEWKNIQWEMMRYIGSMMGGKERDRFLFRYVDPIGGEQEVVCYCGDREWDGVLCTDRDDREWIGTLRVSIIEI